MCEISGLGGATANDIIAEHARDVANGKLTSVTFNALPLSSVIPNYQVGSTSSSVDGASQNYYVGNEVATQGFLANTFVFSHPIGTPIALPSTPVTTSANLLGNIIDIHNPDSAVAQLFRQIYQGVDSTTLTNATNALLQEYNNANTLPATIKEALTNTTATPDLSAQYIIHNLDQTLTYVAGGNGQPINAQELDTIPIFGVPTNGSIKIASVALDPVSGATGASETNVYDANGVLLSVERTEQFPDGSYGVYTYTSGNVLQSIYTAKADGDKVVQTYSSSGDLNTSATLNTQKLIDIQQYQGDPTLIADATIEVGTGVVASITEGADQSVLSEIAYKDTLGTSDDYFGVVANADGSLDIVDGEGEDGTSGQLIDFAIGGLDDDSISIAQAATGAVDVTADVEQNTTVKISSNNAVSGVTQDVSFLGSSGTLQIDNPTSFTGSILGLAPGDIIDLTGIGTASGAMLGANNVLTVDTSSGNLTLNFDPTQNFTADSFITARDGNGGTDILLSSLVGLNGGSASVVNPETGEYSKIEGTTGLNGFEIGSEAAENGYLYVNSSNFDIVNIKTGEVTIGSPNVNNIVSDGGPNGTGALVGISGSNVVAVNPITGTTTQIASVAGLSGFQVGAEAAGNGYFYVDSDGAGQGLEFYAVNIRTGQVISSASSGALFTTDVDTGKVVGINGKNVVIIDPMTGATTDIANIAELDGIQIGALAAENGYLYFNADTTSNANMLYSVDISTGQVESVAAVAGNFLTDPNVDLTVAELATYGSTIDAGISGLSIVDTAANIEAGLATLTADASEIGSITVTDANAPALTVAAATTLGTTWNKSQGVFAISDTKANLQSLTASEITTLAADGATELTSTDANIFYTSAQSAAIRAAGLALSAPSDDSVFEGFADGSSFLQHFDSDDALFRSRTTSADGSFEVKHLNSNGAAYTSYQADFSSSGSVAARFFELDDGGGKLRIFGSQLQIDAAAGTFGPSSNPSEFTFPTHQDEAYVFLPGASNDVVNFASGFGDDVVRGFDEGNSGDVLNLSGVFVSFAAAQGAMTAVGQSTIITDVAGDTLKIVGIAPGSFTAAQLGFSS